MSKQHQLAAVRTYQKIVAKIIQLIAVGEFKAGGRLPTENQLAQRFKVSRAPVREAIIALEVMGKLEVRHGSGAYILPPDTYASPTNYNHNPFELIETRSLVESEVSALAVSTISEEQLDQLQSTIKLMHATHAEDIDSLRQAENEFHTILVSSTLNRSLIDIVRNLMRACEHSTDIRTTYKTIMKHERSVFIQQHQTIFNALQLKNPQGSRANIREHFSFILNALHNTSEERAMKQMLMLARERRERYSLNRIPADIIVDDTSTLHSPL
ncbi:GntR family transcriptional regulator [Gilvimarinus agarilyticus]|uniref:FadR/GntR family transcriptional regulator n=1 Tax=Gilvimarinus sp. 2_MG-2023 TaxID=3062666 RepID=UPI001C086AA2|nr:GntR family transcriptional regulator [Gilvimarinus sp. 2_MG-2023]MBU2884284.1 GntR family transcriptional regulator [Gilvimarinus agarilyticus]MDO6569422.1 GntR family transcriptional regulator [Gilvimarinus sp. 2_MG-2023]